MLHRLSSRHLPDKKLVAFSRHREHGVALTVLCIDVAGLREVAETPIASLGNALAHQPQDVVVPLLVHLRHLQRVGLERLPINRDEVEEVEYGNCIHDVLFHGSETKNRLKGGSAGPVCAGSG